MKVSSPSTGISLEVATTSPGLQFYSGGLLSTDAQVTGKGGTEYPRFGGFAVETQVLPLCSVICKRPGIAVLMGDIVSQFC